MAKRKRSHILDPPVTGKRARKRTSVPLQASSPLSLPSSSPLADYSQQEFKVRNIIDEKNGKYLIDWEDNELTGEAYEPTWEPKAFANQLAVDDWNRKKAAKALAAKADSPSTERLFTTSPDSSPEQLQSRGIKQGQASDSYSPTSPFRSPLPSTNGHAAGLQGASSYEAPEPEVAETPPASNNEDRGNGDPALTQQSPHSRRSRGAFVLLSDPPSSFYTGAYQAFSSFPQSSLPESSLESPILQRAQVQQSTAEDNSQPQDSLIQFSQDDDESGGSRVVPDSQGLPHHDFSSFQGFSDSSASRTASGAATQSLPVSTASLTQQSRVYPIAPPQARDGAALDPPSTTTGTSWPGTTLLSESGGSESGQRVKANTASKEKRQTETYPTALVDEPSQQALISGPEVFATGTPSQQPSLDQDQLRETSAKIATATVSELPTQTLHEKDATQNQGSLAELGKPVCSQGTELLSNAPQIDLRTAPADTSIFISSGLPSSSINYTTPPDYDPPPAGQRLPPSSFSEGRTSRTEASPTFQSLHSGLRSGADDGLESAVQSPAVSQQPRSPLLASRQASGSTFEFQTQLPPYSISADVENIRRLDPRPSAIRAPSDPQHFVTSLQASSIRSAQTLDSSPIATIPSCTLKTIGESAPARLKSPTQSVGTSLRPPANDSTQTPESGTSLVEKPESVYEGLKKAHRNPSLPVNPTPLLPSVINAEVVTTDDRCSASPISSVRDTMRSPSAVPASEPIELISKDEMNTSERYSTLVPQAQGHNSDHDDQNVSLSASGPSSPVQEPDKDPELANAYVVPIPLNRHQSDQYVQNIYTDRIIVDNFLDDPNPEENQLVVAERLIERWRDIVMHPDLVNVDTLTQVSSPERQAQWDVNCSGKFHFLGELLQNFRDSHLDMHVGVAVRGHKAPAMLETFLQGIDVPYKRNLYSQSIEDQADTSRLRVSIIDLDQDLQIIDNVDILVAMDGSVDHKHRIIRAFRRHARTAEMSETNAWATLLILVSPKTVEHIERNMLPDMPRTIRLRKLLAATLKYKSYAGKCEPGQFGRKEAAAAIAAYMADPGKTEWPLVGLGSIRDLDSQTQSDDKDAVASLEALSTDQDDAHTGKRSFEMLEVDTPALAKKPRPSPAIEDASQSYATINPQEMEITYVSDSVGKGTQIDSGATAASAAPDSTEQQLMQVLEYAQSQLDEHVKALEDLQYRHEDQHKELIQVKKTQEHAVSLAEKSLARMTLTETDNAALRTERTALKQQLEEANRRLLDHSVPERREFEVLRDAAKQAGIDKEKAEKRAQQTEKQLEFTRETYQTASSQVQQLAAEIRDLTERLAVAEKQASGEQARVQAATDSRRWKALIRENEKLRLIVEDREMGMKFRDEEIARLKEATRGRVATRNTSLPRCPRVTSPAKKGGSRQASPAAGEPRGRGSNLNPHRGEK